LAWAQEPDPAWELAALALGVQKRLVLAQDSEQAHSAMQPRVPERLLAQRRVQERPVWAGWRRVRLQKQAWNSGRSPAAYPMVRTPNQKE